MSDSIRQQCAPVEGLRAELIEPCPAKRTSWTGLGKFFAGAVLGILAGWSTGIGARADHPEIAFEQSADLAARVSALEQRLANPRMQAPFEVVGANGKPIVRVFESAGEGTITILNAKGDIGAAVSGSGNVGVFSNGDAVAGIKAESDGRGAVLVGSGGARHAVMTVTPGTKSEGMFAVNDSQGKIGAAMSGSGNVGVFSNGDAVVGLKAEKDGRGSVMVGREGKRLAILSADENDPGSGSLVINGASGKPVLKASERISTSDARITIGANQGQFGVTVSGTSGSTQAAFGEAKVGGGVFAAYNTAGQIGAILSGTGQIHVADASGRSFATMVAESGQGAFTIRSKSGTTVARLGEGTGGGLLQLANQGGNAMVEAGIHTSGVGLVRTFPIGSPSATMVGMPGTFLLGRAGGK